MSNSIIGSKIQEYVITELIGTGCFGQVYRAENKEFSDTTAIKLIPLSIIEEKESWEQEIIKVNKLRNSGARVVECHTHGTTTIGNVDYLYIVWDYIPGQSLKDLIETHQITIQMAVDVIVQSLAVFHACKAINIQHMDFHSGNILVQDVDPLDIEEGRRKIWITDFGCGTFSKAKATPPMDDYNGLARIIYECIAAIDFHQISSRRERHLFRVLKYDFPRYLHETNPTEGEFVREPVQLRAQLFKMFETSENITPYQKGISDFLAAEFIGDRYDEWDALFVPKFLATSDFLDKNICVLTGLRGCGKTMMFRRLSHGLQKKLGPSGIAGEDGFIGFYLNARVLAEAFPWLPDEKIEEARRQVLNFFNVKWCIEILRWMRECVREEPYSSVDWLSDYFAPFVPEGIFTSVDSIGIINNVIWYCRAELLRTKLDSHYHADGIWRFSDYSFLSDFISEISNHHGYTMGKSIFLFLDDYSSPMINDTMQKILNPVIFRRTSNLFFKISTESSESFVNYSLNNKVLENGADYKLVDLGSELFKGTQEKERIKDIIISILEKRIERSSLFSKKGISLRQLLGENEYNNNKLAYAIRRPNKKVLYSGIDMFCDLWSSDIRELIKIFSDMLSMEEAEKIEQLNVDDSEIIPIISRKNQDKVLRDAGGRYLRLLTGTANPSGAIPIQDSDETYGEHLRDIVIAFQDIASFDLKYKNSKNQGATPPKQARKIELTSTNRALNDVAADYYRGLIRYGVFIQDYRAKSVRGVPAQRLYLRGLLIPYSLLTFSRRDCITLDWGDFEKFLMNPRQFAEDYKAKYKSENTFIVGQLSMDDY